MPPILPPHHHPLCPTAGPQTSKQVPLQLAVIPSNWSTLQRADRHEWGWGIPVSRCPESIGLICPDPLPGCPATTAFEGVQHFSGLRSFVWVFPLRFFSALFTRLLVDLQFDRSSAGDRPVSSAGDQVGGPAFR